MKRTLIAYAVLSLLSVPALVFGDPVELLVKLKELFSFTRCVELS